MKTLHTTIFNPLSVEEDGGGATDTDGLAIPDVSFDKASEIDALMRRADVARDLRPMATDWDENDRDDDASGVDIAADAIDDPDTDPDGA